MTTKKEHPTPKPKPDLVKITVAFPISPGGPYRADVDGSATAGEVRRDAMAHFGIAEDGQHAYYLTHSGAKVADEATAADVAGEAKAVKLTLVKELIQG